ncbi:hypothetical protein CTAYLR_001468 [Chrysophaeum taylorii]|uniref:Serine hydrolase domain-containing protein n=1 Tax=Chrysophaeum taylorii TaxID=2483200 RepID=A0AAD7XJB9_9STRA|nr:hypothetical protein CTAYLR_001468 [Chrysophaeum taylorii]
MPHQSSPLRILCLHSFQTNGAILKAQLRFANYETMIPDAEFEFADGVSECADEAKVDAMLKSYFPRSKFGPYREWWNAQKVQGTVVYENFDEAVESVARRLRAEPPIDGLLGFSQGGSLAATVLAMQLKGKLPDTKPLRFVWVQGCFRPRHPPAVPDFQNLDSAPPVLATAYEDDPLVPPSLTRDLASCFPGATFVELEGRAHKVAKLVDGGDPATRQILDFFAALSRTRESRVGLAVAFEEAQKLEGSLATVASPATSIRFSTF